MKPRLAASEVLPTRSRAREEVLCLLERHKFAVIVDLSADCDGCYADGALADRDFGVDAAMAEGSSVFSVPGCCIATIARTMEDVAWVRRSLEL